MPAAVEADISFGLRMQMRERILAWISRDVGLREFLIPDLLTDSWTQEQRQAWTNHIMDKYLHANSVHGRDARRRILACETAGSLRRHCVRLRQRTASFRDIMKTSVSLESLWNDISAELDDATWAKCCRWFDVALSSLRVSYVWMYLKSEASGPDASEEARKGLFKKLINTFFVSKAPTDDIKDDRHSSNFKDLLKAWHKDLQVMLRSRKFDAELKRLEEVNSLSETAACIERFLGGVEVDTSWILKMQKLDKDIATGRFLPKSPVRPKIQPRKGRGRPRKQVAPPKEDPNPRRSQVAKKSNSVKPTKEEEDDADADRMAESESSFEPHDADGDFDAKDAAEADADADADAEADSDSDEDEAIPERTPVRTSLRHLAKQGTRISTLRNARKRTTLDQEMGRPAKRRAVQRPRSPAGVDEDVEVDSDDDSDVNVKHEGAARVIRRERLTAILEVDDSQSQQLPDTSLRRSSRRSK